MSTKTHTYPLIAALILGISFTFDASARTISPNPIVIQQVGDVAVLNIADEGSCNADVLVTSLDLGIIQALSTNPTQGVNVEMELIATGVGTTQLLVEWIEFGLDADLNACADGGAATVDVVVGPVPMRAEVLDAQTGLPITNARVYAREPREFYGFRALPTSTPGVYASSPADLHPWKMKVFAPGYEPSPVFELIQDIHGAIAGTVYLAPDPDFIQPNILKVRIQLLTTLGTPTGQRILTDSVVLSKDSVDLGLNPTFGRGNMIYPGVPAGTISVSVPDTPGLDFSTATIKLGTGVVREVVLDATLLASSSGSIFATSSESIGPVASRGSLPGDIVGDVYNSGTNPQEVIEGAVVISKQDANNISTYVESNQIGAFYHPNIAAGSGEIYALSPDETIQGPSLPVNVQAGQTYGDTENEDTGLTVPLSPADSDGDGLPDEFEQAYLQGYPEDQQGANDDPDGDGLTNLEEYHNGTDPSNPDSDGDGFSDGLELERGTDALDANSVPSKLAIVWVDFGFDDPVQAGTLHKPVGTLSQAVDLVAEGGTIRIKGDVETTSSSSPNTVITSATYIESSNGHISVSGN